MQATYWQVYRITTSMAVQKIFILGIYGFDHGSKYVINCLMQNTNKVTIKIVVYPIRRNVNIIGKPNG